MFSPRGGDFLSLELGLSIKMTVKKTLPDLETVRNDERVRLMLEAADHQMEQLGYTEHGIRHASVISKWAKQILFEFGYPERTAEIASIAAYLHDIGNLVARSYHGHSSALLAYPVLLDLGFPYEEIYQIMGALGNHEDEDGAPTTPIDAAVVIADKSDVHRSRVREWDPLTTDIHDRVNLAVTSSKLIPDPKNMTITLDVDIDTSISSVMDYLHIFLDRMDECYSAGRIINAQFQLVINGVKLYKEDAPENNKETEAVENKH